MISEGQTYKIFSDIQCGPFKDDEPFNDVFLNDLLNMAGIGSVLNFLFEPFVMTSFFVAALVYGLYKLSTVSAYEAYVEFKLSNTNNTIKAMNEIIQKMRNQIKFLFKSLTTEKKKKD